MTEPPPEVSVRELAGYFLRLGTVGFGGPIALAGYMQRDLVERRRWLTSEDYKQGLALAQLSPGPLAAQLAMYLGWVRAGTLGASVEAGAFIFSAALPSWFFAAGVAGKAKCRAGTAGGLCVVANSSGLVGAATADAGDTVRADGDIAAVVRGGTEGRAAVAAAHKIGRAHV